jgi:hypothetical protein
LISLIQKGATARRKYIKGKSVDKLLSMLKVRPENEDELPFITGMIRTIEEVTDSQVEAY